MQYINCKSKKRATTCFQIVPFLENTKRKFATSLRTILVTTRKHDGEK